MASEDRIIPKTGLNFSNNTPSLAVKGAICFKCHKEAPKLLKCGKCKRVRYCSLACQKQDWAGDHKQLCLKLVSTSGSYTNDGLRDPRGWDEYRAEILSKIPIWKGLCNLSDRESRILILQPYCSTCYRHSNQLPGSTKLVLCSTCKLAHHCSTCTPAQHVAQCPALVDVRHAEEFSIQNHRETGQDFSPRMDTEAPRTSYLPLSSATSWYDYYTKVSDKIMVQGLLTTDLKPVVGNTEMSAAVIAATDEMSMFLTIIAGLEAVNCATKPVLKLNLVGATSMELNSLTLFEELLHLLPTLQELHVTFVGPSMPKPVFGSESLKLDCCPACTEAKRTRWIKMYNGAYHDYVNSETAEMPDLAIAFQTGHTSEEQDSWAPTIRNFAQEAEHPTLFTTFNEAEMLGELESLKQLGARFIVEGERNKWRGMRPMLDPLEEVESMTYYQHQYWYIVAGQATKS